MVSTGLAIGHTAPPSAPWTSPTAVPRAAHPAIKLAAALTLRDVPAYRASLDAGLSRAAAQWILDHPEASSGAKLSTVRALALVLAVDPAWLAWGAPYPAPKG